MRSSTLLALIGATLAAASPVHQALHANHVKKALAYEIVTDIVYVTVTEGALAPTSTLPDTTVIVAQTVYVNPIEASSQDTHSYTQSSSIYHAPPPPSSTYVPPPPPTTTSVAPPPPQPTTQAPVVVVATTEAAPVPATTAPAAAVQQPVASSPAPSDSMAAAAVSNHNTCRSSHSAPAVTYNETLAQWAANTASTCVFAHDM